MLRVLGEPVQLGDLHAKAKRHLVDERACTAGAVTVHTEVGDLPVLEVYDLSVLTAYVDDGGYFRVYLFREFRGGDHLLDEGDVVSFRHAQPYGSRDGERELFR